MTTKLAEFYSVSFILSISENLAQIIIFAYAIHYSSN